MSSLDVSSGPTRLRHESQFADAAILRIHYASISSSWSSSVTRVPSFSCLAEFSVPAAAPVAGLASAVALLLPALPVPVSKLRDLSHRGQGNAYLYQHPHWHQHQHWPFGQEHIRRMGLNYVVRILITCEFEDNNLPALAGFSHRTMQTFS